MIHLYIGDGKGKTTAAVGLATRAAGCGRNVVFAQFLKGSNTGEIVSLETLGVRVIRSERNMGFIWNMDSEKQDAFRMEQARLLEAVAEMVFGVPSADVLILDEALDGIATNMLDDGAFMDLITRKPDGLEIVITGRAAPDWLTERADYITEMKKIRHPYDLGAVARQGIEY